MSVASTRRSRTTSSRPVTPDRQSSLARQSAISSHRISSQSQVSSNAQSPPDYQNSSSRHSSHSSQKVPSVQIPSHGSVSKASMISLNLSDEIPGFFGQIVTPSHPDYPISIARWAYNAQRPARLVTYPRFITDIFAAISYAYKNSVPLAVRGGGHSCAGTSSVTNGLVIDLSRHFARVRIDFVNRIAFVGGGAVWRDVDEAAIKHGLAAVGGTVNHTGVGGLTLGGGYGWLTGEHSLACDNVIAATIITPGAVDPSGILHPTSRTVSAVSDPDLFFAIRGGGGNFGVVTEFAIKLHLQRRTVWSGTLTYDPGALEDVFTALEEWWKEAGVGKRPGEAALVFFFVDPVSAEPRLGVRPFFNGHGSEGKKRFSFLFSIEYLDDQTRELPYELMNAQQNEQARPGDNMYMTGTSRNHFSPIAARALFATFAEIATTTYSASAVIVEYLPLHLVRAQSSESSAFPGRAKGDNIVFLVHWPRDSENGSPETARAHAARLKETVWWYERQGGGDVDTHGYGNYQTDIANHDSSAQLFGNLYPRLQAIKSTHDPHGLFDKFYPIKPLAQKMVL